MEHQSVGYALLIVFGLVLTIFSPFGGGQFIKFGFDQISLNHQMERDDIEHRRRLELMERSEKSLEAEFERQMQLLRSRRDLNRKAEPEEGY